MADPSPNSVLARKIAIHARGPISDVQVMPAAQNAFRRALRHAALPFEGLGLIVGKTQFLASGSLDAAVDAMPRRGLVAAIEDGQGQRGLVGLSAGLIDALIEAQTTGRVEEKELPPRPVTRIDEALCRDFLDLTFGAFAREAEEIAGRTWPLHMTYGSRIADMRRINLLLPEGHFHQFSAEVSFDGVERMAQIVLALPVDLTASKATRPNQADTGGDPDWNRARDAVLGGLPLQLEAVLMRVTKPLGQVERLSEGDLLTFPATDLQTLSLENGRGHCVAKVRLGQIGGYRAVRVGDGAAAAQHPHSGGQFAALPASDPMMGSGPATQDASPSGPMDMGLPMDDGNAMGMPDLPDLPEPMGLPDFPMAPMTPMEPMGDPPVFDPDAVPDPSAFGIG